MVSVSIKLSLTESLPYFHSLIWCRRRSVLWSYLLHFIRIRTLRKAAWNRLFYCCAIFFFWYVDNMHSCIDWLPLLSGTSPGTYTNIIVIHYNSLTLVVLSSLRHIFIRRPMRSRTNLILVRGRILWILWICQGITECIGTLSGVWETVAGGPHWYTKNYYLPQIVSFYSFYDKIGRGLWCTRHISANNSWYNRI